MTGQTCIPSLCKFTSSVAYFDIVVAQVVTDTQRWCDVYTAATFLSLFSSWYKRSFSVSRCNIIPFVDATFLVNNETSCDLSGDCVREDGSITLSHGHSDPHSGRLVAYTWTALDDEALFEGKTQTFPSLEYQLLFARTAGSDIRSGDLRDEWEASTSD